MFDELKCESNLVIFVPIRIEIQSLLMLASVSDLIPMSNQSLSSVSVRDVPVRGLVAYCNGENGLVFKAYFDFCKELSRLFSFMVSFIMNIENSSNE